MDLYIFFLLRQDKMLNSLKTFKICNEVEQLLFLLYGPIGAGKSSTINTIRNVFEGRQFVNCLAARVSNMIHTLHVSQYKVFNFLVSCMHDITKKTIHFFFCLAFSFSSTLKLQ